MTDHVNSAINLINRAARLTTGDFSGDPLSVAQGTAMLVEAQVEATLEVAEQVEFAGDQLRRLADGVQALVDVVRAHLGSDEPVGDGPRLGEAVDDRPCAFLIGDTVVGVKTGAPCGVALGEHYAVRDHEWIGARTHGPAGPLVPTGESGVSKSPDGGR